MPSASESGNNAMVDNKSRPNNAKNPDPPKYTDVTRTSSASFRPPMSKDPVLKKKTDVPQADASWFGPLSYIKNMFGGKAAAEPAQVPNNSEKNKKIPQVKPKNTSNAKKAPDVRETGEDHTFRTDDPQTASFYNKDHQAIVKTEHSPRFSFTPDEATNRRTKEKPMAKKHEEDDPNGPKYNALRFVENKSTYLHTPDKRGTTSFRITTSSKVKSKPAPAVMSPILGNNASKRMRRSPVLSRNSSASPKKIPQNESNTANNFPTRLRSKSTPDHSSIKPRPVSDTTYPKSVSLKSTSNKIVSRGQSDVNENRAEVAFVKTTSKHSFPNKPTILGSQTVVKQTNKKNPSRSSKSSLQIGAISLPQTSKLTRSSSAGDNRAAKQNTKDSTLFQSERGHAYTKTSKTNILRSTNLPVNDKAHSKEHPANTRRTNLDKKAPGKKAPIARSPSFTQPSLVGTRTPVSRTRAKDADALTKFVNAQQRAKDKLKSRMDALGEKKIEPQKMVLPATFKNSPIFNHKPVRVTNSDNSSPKSNATQRKGKPGLVRDISSTIAESPVRLPSPPARAMCLISYKNGDKMVNANQEVKMINPTEESKSELPLVLPGLMEENMSSTEKDIETSVMSPFESISQREQEHDECQMTLNTPIDSETLAINYIDQKENDHIEKPYALQSSCTDHPIEGSIYHTSSEYQDISNSATSSDDCSLECYNEMDTTKYEIDIFKDECDIELDTCNSALPKNAVTSGKCHEMHETDGIEAFELPRRRKVSARHVSNKGELLPFQEHIDSDSVKFFADQVPMETSSYAVAMSKAPRSETFSATRNRSRDSSRSSDSARRKSPPNVQSTRRRSPPNIKFTPVRQDMNNERNQSVSPKLLSSKNQKRVHKSQFLSSPTVSAKRTSGYLESINRPIVPTALEPTILQEKKAVTLHGTKSPARAPYRRPTHDITLSSIATSVGDALDSLTDKFKQTFPSVLKVAKSPDRTNRAAEPTGDTSPNKPIAKPTQLITDRPFSATATYISTILEDNNRSPMLKRNTAEKDVKKVDDCKHETLVNKDVTPTMDVIPPPPEVKKVVENKPQKNKVVETKNTGKNKSPTIESTKNTVSDNPTKQSDSPLKIDTPDLKPIVCSPAKEGRSVTESIKKSFEDTKNILASVFSPPIKMPVKLPKTVDPELPMPKKEVEPVLQKMEGENVKKPEWCVKDGTRTKPILQVKKNIDSDPAKWPTFTKPGFAKIKGSPTDDSVKPAIKQEPSPANTAPTTASTTANVVPQTPETAATQNTASTKEGPKPPENKDSTTADQKAAPKEKPMGYSLKYHNEFNIFE